MIRTTAALAAALLVAACIGPFAKDDEVGPPPFVSLEPAEDCPVVANRAWGAFITANNAGDAAYLNVVGQVDMPTPGWEARLVLGPTDRMAPPSQIVVLELTPPSGVTAQVVTPLEVEAPLSTRFTEFRSVRIRCGSGGLAVIENVALF